MANHNWPLTSKTKSTPRFSVITNRTRKQTKNAWYFMNLFFKSNFKVYIYSMIWYYNKSSQSWTVVYLTSNKGLKYMFIYFRHWILVYSLYSIRVSNIIFFTNWQKQFLCYKMWILANFSLYSSTYMFFNSLMDSLERTFSVIHSFLNWHNYLVLLHLFCL